VGLRGRGRLPEEIDTLAERLKAAGYETASFSENPSVSDLFQMLQGFETRVAARIDGMEMTLVIDAAEELERWLATRTSDAPLFVFVNLNDPHSPYEVREENRFLPETLPRAQIQTRSPRPFRFLCGGLPGPKELEIQRGLYHGDVHEADAKVGRIVRALRGVKGAQPLLVVATSDHGEHFGEDRLMGHEFGLHQVVLRVPLIVHGLSSGVGETRDETAKLLDVAPSILEWTGVRSATPLPGRVLPIGAAAPAPTDRTVLAAFDDTKRWLPAKVPLFGKVHDRDANRQFCSKMDRVWGGMATVIRYPFKLRWWERYPPELYDLRWDTAERSNQAGIHPELVEQLTRELAPFLESTRLDREDASVPETISDEAVEALRALGYVE
jgi:arylsulfatase A-like enzyme